MRFNCSFNYKKSLAAFALALPMLGAQGCTEREVGAGAIGAGAALVAERVFFRRDHDRDRDYDRDDYRRRDWGYRRDYRDHGGGRYVYRCVGGYRRSCSNYYDYGYGYHSGCRTVWDSCAYRSRRLENLSPAGDEKGLQRADLMNIEVSPVRWAEAFNTSHGAAERLVKALKDARAGKKASLEKLGFQAQDLHLISKFQLPSEHGIDQVSRNLNLAPKTTKTMIQDLINRAKAERI